MTITEFLNARYDEEWELASGAMTDHFGTVYDHARFQDEFESHDGESTPEQRAFINHFDPRRTFADIAARRAIVAAAVETLAVEEVGFPADERGLAEAHSLAEFTILTFAQVFAEHVDFDPAWRV